MSKAILIFINIIGFLYLTILNIKKTEITHNGPKQIEIGQELEVNIIINKNDFSGPGRLRLDLSEAKGIEVIEKNSNGASFTFKNNEVLFIWYDLPNNQNIEISYLIKTKENISSMNKISGDFSFVNKDERKQLDIPELTFEVKGDELATVKEDENKSGIVITRNIMKIDSGYIVTIKTQLEDHKGFARIKDVLPMNYNAEVIESNNAVFKNIDGCAKFIWSKLSKSKQEILVKYLLKRNDGIDTNFVITGDFSSEKLISQGYKNGVKIPETIYEVYKDKILFTQDQNDSSTFAINSKEIDSIENLESNLNKGLDNVITSQKVKNNINYKVQILAGHKIISQKYLSNKFKFNENYSIESHKGWIKYTVGDNSEYSKARNDRNELDKYNFPGPFVTAYNYGNRVTVQEALILTNQNWIP